MAVSISFTADQTRGDFPLIVNFTNTSTGGADTWFWDFGDGGTSTDENPTYEYLTGPAEGESYTATLTGHIVADATSIPFSTYGTLTSRSELYNGTKGSTGGESDASVWSSWQALLPHTGWTTNPGSLNIEYRYALTGNGSNWGRSYYGNVIRDMDLDYTSYAESTHIAYATITWQMNQNSKVYGGGAAVYPVASDFPTTVSLTPDTVGSVKMLQNFSGHLGSAVNNISIIDNDDYDRRLSNLDWNQDLGTAPWGYRGAISFTLLSFPTADSFSFSTLIIGHRFTANFSGTPRLGDDPLAVQFTDLSSPDPENWRWNFGDGTGLTVAGIIVGSTHQNPLHTYTFEECD